MPLLKCSLLAPLLPGILVTGIRSSAAELAASTAARVAMFLEFAVILQKALVKCPR